MVYKDGESMILLEKDTFFSTGLTYKMKDNRLEWLDRVGNNLISIGGDRVEIGKMDLRYNFTRVNMDRVEMGINGSDLLVKGGSIILDDYRLMDKGGMFNLREGNWDWNGVNFGYNGGLMKRTGVRVENMNCVESNIGMELEYGGSRINWMGEKGERMMFMGEKSLEYSFPNIEYNNSDIVYRGGEGITFFGKNGWRYENQVINYVNSKINVEKNGFGVFGVSGDEVMIKNVPLKLSDSYFNYIYEKKNGQLLIKNDLFYSNYMDYEIKNGIFNWNQKFMLMGNQCRMNEITMELLGSNLVLKGKGRIEMGEIMELEDVNFRYRSMKSDVLLLEKNMMKLEGNFFMKGGRFYNECFILEPNSLRITNAQQRMKSNDIYYEDCNLNMNDGSSIKIGDWEIGVEEKLNFISGTSSIKFGGGIGYKEGDRELKIGGFDVYGNGVLLDDGKIKFIERDGELLVRLGKIEMEERYVERVGGERYICYERLIESLVRRVSELESIMR
jgi:hypothetical protein